MKVGDKVRVVKTAYPYVGSIDQSLVGKTGVVTAVGTSGEQSACVRFENFNSGHSGENIGIRSKNHWYFVPSVLKVVRKKKTVSKKKVKKSR